MIIHSSSDLSATSISKLHDTLNSAFRTLNEKAIIPVEKNKREIEYMINAYD